MTLDQASFEIATTLNEIAQREGRAMHTSLTFIPSCAPTAAKCRSISMLILRVPTAALAARPASSALWTNARW